MKFIFVSFILVISISMGSYAQMKTVINQQDLSNIIKIQAAKMGQAFVSEDYIIYAKYDYPKIVALMGGQEKMISTLKKAINDMKLKGMVISNITFGEPSKIIKNENELQCTIQQHTEMKIPSGRAIASSTLIVISIDNGKSWKFIDTSGKDLVTFRKIMPNLSNALVIPTQQQPVYYSN